MMNDFLSLHDKIGAKGHPLARFNSVQRCTALATGKTFERCHFDNSCCKGIQPMAGTFPNCSDSSSHMHGAYPQALNSHALFDHRSMGDKPNCGSGEYPEKDVAAPKNEQ
jgi:hypothetical protein